MSRSQSRNFLTVTKNLDDDSSARAGWRAFNVITLRDTMMGQRLNYDWFHRYVIDPAALRPGTRMPTFWPEGEAVNKDILDGKTEAQINAIWAYLSKGRDADLPAGLVTGRKEIVAANEAVIYRNFIDGAGPRAIGVGYPEKANLAFDANAVRIAEIWQGAFIDAARHSNGRGEGFEKPLGEKIHKMPAGPAFAILEDSNAEWPGDTFKFKMLGYRLDEKRRPIFRYEFSGVTIEDFPLAVATELDPYFSRKITVTGDAKNLWFRAATGEIESKPDGSFLVDKKLSLKFSGAKPVLGKSGLLVPVQIKNGKAEFIEEIRW
jgi:hypothetical protein